MNDNPIVVENLVKYYEGRCVLDAVSFTVPRGCIYGLLGRNGCGKTTMIRILLGLESPTRGRTVVLGQDSTRLSARTHGRIGYVAEGHHLIQNYKVHRLIGLCKGLSLQWNEEFFGHLVETFRLPMDRKVKELSTGMRAQLNLALAMAIDPELLILDDPTLGLDTIARRQFLELAIDVIQRQGRTILFSSHILSDVERIADRVGVLVAGKLVVDCTLEELKSRIKKLRVIFPEQAPENLYLTEIVNQQRQGREMVLTVANWNPQKQAILETFRPESCTELPMTLEDIFIECTRPAGAVVPHGSGKARCNMWSLIERRNSRQYRERGQSVHRRCDHCRHLHLCLLLGFGRRGGQCAQSAVGCDVARICHAGHVPDVWRSDEPHLLAAVHLGRDAEPDLPGTNPRGFGGGLGLTGARDRRCPRVAPGGRRCPSNFSAARSRRSPS